jgi:hypothetical protein
MSRSSCAVLPVPFCLSSFAWHILPVQFCLSWLPVLSACLVLPVQFYLSRYSCPVSSCPVLPECKKAQVRRPKKRTPSSDEWFIYIYQSMFIKRNKYFESYKNI